MSVEEYLRTSFDGPDRDYVDGEVLERNVGEHPHSEIQWLIGALFAELSKRVPVHGRPELSIQVTPSRFRNIWIVDPWTRRLYTYDGSLREAHCFELSEFAFRIEHANLFS